MIGLTIFSIGLFKKVTFADSFVLYATPVFDTAAKGGVLNGQTAWLGTLAYTFQIYFDFSGYSDMAIGLARMVGINLPINFNAPYRSTSITEFWRRWHITLGRFLRDYLYFPLGGSRVPPLRHFANLMAVMLLCGLWHGAAWTFIIWGGLHGLALSAHGLRLQLSSSETSRSLLVAVLRVGADLRLRGRNLGVLPGQGSRRSDEHASIDVQPVLLRDSDKD